MSLTKQILTDLKIDLADKFDRNFERKGFFGKRWTETKHPNNRGSLMQRSGKLRRSIKAKVQGNAVVFSSSLPYAAIHNEGGKIKVTKKMIRYFWAMYYQCHNATQVYSIKKKQQVNNARTRKLSTEAEKWKNMALMKVGSTITIPQRQFLGHYPGIDKTIEKIVRRNMEEALEQIIKNVNAKINRR